MAGIRNGTAAHRPLRPYCSTFLIFSNVMRPSIRLAVAAVAGWARPVGIGSRGWWNVTEVTPARPFL